MALNNFLKKTTLVTDKSGRLAACAFEAVERWRQSPTGLRCVFISIDETSNL